jgi:hypothetical protein
VIETQSPTNSFAAGCNSSEARQWIDRGHDGGKYVFVLNCLPAWSRTRCS